MILRDILYQVKIQALNGDTGIDISALQIDSRKVQPGDCFIAIPGNISDGHQFIDKAIHAGAVAIVCEKIPATVAESVTYIEVADSALAAGEMSHLFFGEPTHTMQLVGVTGTNGKTTVATLLHHLFTELGYLCGLISTIQNQVGDTVIPATHTTPDPIQLNALLKQMKDAGCTYVFIESSSHAIDQKRIAGLQFRGAIFTNISHDHLDYHKTFDAYVKAKKQWFDSLPSSAFALSNKDDKRGTVMLQNTAAKKYYYSMQSLADFKGRLLENRIDGLLMSINDTEVYCKLIGGFNAYNLLAIYGAAICLGEDKEKVLVILSKLKGAEGRFDTSLSKSQKILGIVDYAHTPDALINVLSTIQNLRKGNEKLISVVGCGGNRDTSKRPLMAKVACQYSDTVIFTSDNPRNEDPEIILDDMEAGVDAGFRRKYIRITDRREAIKTAVNLSQTEDIILIAGKGHEKYQEIKGVRIDFDDKAILNELFELLEKNKKSIYQHSVVL